MDCIQPVTTMSVNLIMESSVHHCETALHEKKKKKETKKQIKKYMIDLV